VREKGYTIGLALITRQLEIYAPSVKVAPCRWGENVGAKLNRDGASIPSYGETRGVGVSPAEEEQALWEILLRDPAFELAMLASTQTGQNAVPPNAVRQLKVSSLSESQEIEKALADIALDQFWPQALIALEQTSGFKIANKPPVAGGPAHRLALSRAIVASLMKAALEVGGPALDAVTRDRLARMIANLLGDDARGVLGMVTAPFKGLAETIGTWQIRRKRTSITDAVYPAAGDILLYQAKGEAIREYVRKQLDMLPNNDIFVLAHSLGGVASFELLVQKRLPNVKGLITFGSQAPFFYEIGALQTIECGAALPDYFPPWINFYDLNDPLSYIGEKLFEGRVSDHKVKSGESFPASHSAYLHSKDLWLQIAAFINHA